jgi:ribosomal-protein-alanine N-acetyltransferase
LIQFEPFVAGHLDRVLRLEQEAYAGRDPWTRAAFEHELASPASLWLVAVDGPAVAGYAGGWVLAGQEYHLLNVAVAAARRRQGVGRAMLTALLARAHAHGCRSAVLEVRRENETARRLYEGLGFRAEGVRKGYYTDGEDAMIYLLDRLTP